MNEINLVAMDQFHQGEYFFQTPWVVWVMFGLFLVVGVFMIVSYCYKEHWWE